MTAKQYLKQIEILEKKIEQKELQIEDIKASFGEIQAMYYDKPIVKQSISEGLERQFIKLDELYNDAIEKKLNYQTLRDKIGNEIHLLHNPKHIDLLHKRYIEHKSLELISVEMNYSYIDIRREHGKALDEFKTVVLDASNK